MTESIDVAGVGTGEIYHSLSPFLGDQQSVWLHVKRGVSPMCYPHGSLKHYRYGVGE